MTYIIIIIVSLIFSAFFSGMEIAFVASNKLKLEVDKKQEKSFSGILSVFTDKPGQYIATMLVGNNISLVIYGMFMAVILEPVIQNYTNNEAVVLIIQTFISTLIILVTAEFLPKTIFRLSANKTLHLFALPVMFFYVILYPVARLTVIVSDSILKNLFKVDYTRKKQKVIFGKVDLDNFLSELHSADNDSEEMELDVKIFQNALDFSSVKLRECIIPRTDIIAIDINSTLEEITAKFIETGVSKILVYKDSIDNIVGYFHVSELFKRPKTIKSKVRKVSIVPETMQASRLLEVFMKENKSIAVVVDEFGGTSGMVTIEDIIEEIFGEIHDEHDHMELVEKQLTENEFIFSGRNEIDLLNEKYKLNIPESDEYETLAGFILCHHETIPEKKDVISIENFQFQIIKVTNTRIELVRLKILPSDYKG